MTPKIDMLMIFCIFSCKRAIFIPAAVMESHYPLTLPKDGIPVKDTSCWGDLIFTKWFITQLEGRVITGAIPNSISALGTLERILKSTEKYIFPLLVYFSETF